jgi:rod shape-determining protein MreD
MGSHLTLIERVGLLLRMLLPYAAIVFLFLMNMMSVPGPLSVIFKAPFFLMALYFWTIVRPTILPVWIVFAFGLVLDILSGAVLGLNAILFMICRIVIYDQRRFLMSQSFVMNWLGFTVLNAAYHGVQWMLFSLIGLRFLSWHDLWPAVVLGVLFFPLVSMILHVTHKVLPPHVSQATGFNAQRKGVPF